MPPVDVVATADIRALGNPTGNVRREITLDPQQLQRFLPPFDHDISSAPVAGAGGG